MPAFTRSATSAFIALFRSVARPFFFCLTGLLPGMILRLCSITCRSTPVRSVGFQAKTVEYCFRSATSHALVSYDRWAPIRTNCSGYSMLLVLLGGRSLLQLLWCSHHLGNGYVLVAMVCPSVCGEDCRWSLARAKFNYAMDRWWYKV